jgi:two-component system sensor kinase FixL
MSRDRLYERFQELQSYVGWTPDDAQRVVAAAAGIQEILPPLIEDFYDAIHYNPSTRKVIIGGEAQITRLKDSLLRWLRELISGVYDEAYVERRWRVGRRHVEIGLEQVYTNTALSRLRGGLILAVQETWQGDPLAMNAAIRSLNKLLDLDLAIIEDAYQSEYTARLQKAEEERLALVQEQNEATFRNLFETAECMIIILRHDHTIAYFSPFSERLTGYSAEEALGRDYVQFLVPDENRRAVADEFARVLAECPTPGYENPVVCRDGSRRSMTWNARSLADFQGAPGLLKVGQDITYLKQAQERVLQSERLAAIGQMVTGLAHESRNALQRGQACLEMLALTIQDRPAALDLVARIQKAQDHLHHLYEDVRGYAAPITLQRRLCDVNAIWREAWTNLDAARQGRDASLHEQCDGINLRCLVDPFRLGQVFSNLLENALAASPTPVEITISASDLDLHGRKFLQIGIRDNGPGLPAEVRQKIFEPFFTTKTIGTGLGLAITRRIISAHGGWISVANDGNPGALFLITLPRGMQ